MEGAGGCCLQILRATLPVIVITLLLSTVICKPVDAANKASRLADAHFLQVRQRRRASVARRSRALSHLSHALLPCKGRARVEGRIQDGSLYKIWEMRERPRPPLLTCV